MGLSTCKKGNGRGQEKATAYHLRTKQLDVTEGGMEGRREQVNQYTREPRFQMGTRMESPNHFSME